MSALSPRLGQYKAAEIAQNPTVFAAAMGHAVNLPNLHSVRALATIERGSSNAAANILSDEFKHKRGLPKTSLQPTAFSRGDEVPLRPLQLVTNPLSIIILGTEQESVQDRLNNAQARFTIADRTVFRLRLSDMRARGPTTAAVMATLLCLTYRLALRGAFALGLIPDRPAIPAKVTQTQ